MAETGRLEALDPPADSRHRFPSIRYYDTNWDLTHLDSFAFKADIGFEATVVVIFSCHCFSHSFRWEARPRIEIPEAEIYKDEKEERVLDPVRYRLSRDVLRELIMGLPGRHIIVANVESRNFLTWEIRTADDKDLVYAVFFDVERDKHRKKRLILRIQSAYRLDNGLTKRQKSTKKVYLNTLLKAAYEGRVIRP
jgi:hypothetical protein